MIVSTSSKFVVKILAGSKFYGRIRMRLVMGAVVRIQSIVDRILCQFGMQFAPFSVRSLTVIIIYTIGNIACLLKFSAMKQTGPKLHVHDLQAKKEKHRPDSLRKRCNTSMIVLSSTRFTYSSASICFEKPEYKPAPLVALITYHISVLPKEL